MLINPSALLGTKSGKKETAEPHSSILAKTQTRFLGFADGRH
jgi:hypothetical protein